MTDKLVALVTGANKGLGKETARQLAQRGMTVLLGSRDPDRGDAAARELRADGSTVTAVQFEVTDSASVESAAALLRRDYGRLDVLINNAGVFVDRPSLSTTATEMRQTFEINVFGVVTVIHALLPLLREANAPRVVNISSTTGSLARASAAGSVSVFGSNDNYLAYASSKTALNMLTVQYAQAFRRDEALSHLKINSATPGYIATDLNNHSAPRTVQQGARIVVDLATLPDHGPSGGFFNEEGVVPW